MAVVNQGRQIQFINGINGVSAGGNATINMDVNKRYHRNKLLTTSVNYQGGTGLATVKLTGGGNNDLTVTPTVVNGVITAVAVVAGGTGYTTGDTITITDNTGAGFVGTVTAAAGVVSAVAVTSVGTPTATDPTAVLTTLKQVVNGIVIRDISVANILRVLNANGIYPALGELPLDYTEPFFNVNQLNELLSWDMFGQSTFTILPAISGVRTNPGLAGIQEFDNSRNVRPTPQGLVPFLQPVAQHEYSFNIIAGLNLINTIPFDFPIRRMWFKAATAGTLTQLEVLQDGNKVFEATYAQMRQMYEDYGFYFGKANYLNQNYATVNALKAAYNPISAFDFAYISDVDERINKVLSCEGSLVLRVQSTVAQALTIVVESMPGQYAA